MEYSIAIPIFVFVLYGMIFLVQKFLEKGQLLFVTNYHRTEDCEVEIHVPLEASVEEWDALTGNHKTLDVVTGQGQTVFKNSV